MNEPEHTCETCAHERDSGNEYCGSCDKFTDNWEPSYDVIADRVAESVEEEIAALKLRIKELEETVREALKLATGLWAEVGNHPASRWKKEVEFYEKALKGGK